MNVKFLKPIANQINKLNGRILLNAPKIENYAGDSGNNKKGLEGLDAAVSLNNDPAHLVASATMNGTHKPTLDIDFPCVLEPSASPNKFHLFIDKELTSKEYDRLLTVLVDVGIVQKGVLDYQWKTDGMTCARLPGVKKLHAIKPGSYVVDDEIDPF